MMKAQYKNIKPLLYEPGKGGHCPVILKYIIEILTEYGISYHLVDNQIKSKQLVFNLIEIARQENCNILHILTFDGLFMDFFKYSLSKSYLKTPKIVGNYYLYNNLYEFPKSYLFDYLFLSKSVNKLLVSDEFIEARCYPKWKEKCISYIPDPWDMNDFKSHQKNSARKALNLPADQTIFLIFGELSFRKGINFFIDALFKLYLDKVNSFVGVIAGQMHDDVRASETYTKMLILKNESNLIIHDYYIPEELVSKYFSATDFTVCPYPSYFKVSSGTFTRSCAAGVPSIVPDSSNLSLIVNKIGVGYIFRSESVESLALTMKNLINREYNDSQNSSFKLRSFANEKSLEKYGKMLMDNYCEVIC